MKLSARKIIRNVLSLSALGAAQASFAGVVFPGVMPGFACHVIAGTPSANNAGVATLGADTIMNNSASPVELRCDATPFSSSSTTLDNPQPQSVDITGLKLAYIGSGTKPSAPNCSLFLVNGTDQTNVALRFASQYTITAPNNIPTYDLTNPVTITAPSSWYTTGQMSWHYNVYLACSLQPGMALYSFSTQYH